MPCTRDIIDDCVPRSRSLDGLESTSRWLSFRNAPRRPLRFEDPGNGPSWTSACADYDVDQRPLSESDVKRESLSTPQNAAAGLSCTPLFLIPIPLLADHSVRAHFQRATGSDSPTPRSQATAPTYLLDGLGQLHSSHWSTCPHAYTRQPELEARRRVVRSDCNASPVCLGDLAHDIQAQA